MTASMPRVHVAPAWTVDRAVAAQFGPVSLTADQTLWLDSLNATLPQLCRRMPAALQDAALLSIQQHFTNFQLQHLLRFFTKFYPPTWTIVYWLSQSDPSTAPEEIATMLRGQAMAMFLHMLDDHLVDGQIPLDNLLLQLRTEAWTLYAQATADLAGAISDGSAWRDSLISRYFGGVHRPAVPHDLDSYCAGFCHQSATGLVIPVLLARRLGLDSAAICSAYEDFCIAWRLLDDLRDLPDDVAAGVRSGIYYSLDPEGRRAWDACAGTGLDSPHGQALSAALNGGCLDRFAAQIVARLDQAAALAGSFGLPGYAAELNDLAAPLRAAQR